MLKAEFNATELPSMLEIAMSNEYRHKSTTRKEEHVLVFLES
jgi:hypothetical protein